MRRTAWILALLCAVPSSAQAVRWVLEPAVVGADRLDAVLARGLETRTVPRIGAGVGVEPWPGVQFGFTTGVSAGSTGFGLLAGPTARVTHTEAAVEARGRWPRRRAGWGVQGAAGAGRMRLAHHPGSVVLATPGGPLAVDLPPAGTWTRHLAAEVLHAFGRNEVGVRCAWRFYALDVASPAGVRRESLSDVQASIVLRVVTF